MKGWRANARRSNNFKLFAMTHKKNKETADLHCKKKMFHTILSRPPIIKEEIERAIKSSESNRPLRRSSKSPFTLSGSATIVDMHTKRKKRINVVQLQLFYTITISTRSNLDSPKISLFVDLRQCLLFLSS